MKIEIIKADYKNDVHAKDIVKLMNAYAEDKMGGGHVLSLYVQENLVSALAKRTYAFSVLAYVGDEAVGLINCFEAFSTFACEPLVNIHDIIVFDGYRGMGINQKMLAEVERIAKSRGCCKLTLEVLEGNAKARASYEKFGFYGYELDPSMGNALFWQKKL